MRRLFFVGLLLMGATAQAQIAIVNQMRGHGKDWSQSSNCRAYYPFEGAAGTGEGQSWDDACAAGTDNDLATNGTPSPGLQTSCADAFATGINCYENTSGTAGGEYTTADSAEFDVGDTGVTWGCKMRMTADANLGLMDNDGFVTGVELRADANRSATAGVGAVFEQPATNQWTVNSWTSMIARWSPSQGTATGGIEIYINGTMVCSGGAAGCATNIISNNANANQALFLGTAYGALLQGRLDDCFIIAQYLTVAEICGIANFGFKGGDSYRGVC